MQFRMSMVHNNPGEPPFDTAFNNPQKVLDYGYNGQVFKHINTVVTLDEMGLDLFPAGSEDRKWLENFRESLVGEMQAAKAAGLQVYYHIDLFVLPKKLVAMYQDQLCDENGKISLDREMALQVHKTMIDEIFTCFPEIDGLIIRVGETYLHDAPYHTGNGAVEYGDKEREKRQFVKLLNFLRQEICVCHNKKLFFRTWDCFPDRFHADLNYYLDVTGQVEPHENLLFSIKYTALDFWRRVRCNDCITSGNHGQIIEIQCQREYEGKGAYPSYVMDDIINGSCELQHPRGLQNIVNDPLVQGVYVWPRGGGWYGPYPTNEFWCDLNTYVIGAYANNPSKSEEEIFYQYAAEKMKLSEQDSETFRKICLLSSQAILKSRYMEKYDKTLDEGLMPCCNWMRDDRLGGLYQLKPALEVLYRDGKLEQTLAEKYDGLILWQQIRDLCNKIDWTNCKQGEFINVSAEYACRLFTAVCCGWTVMINGFKGDKTGGYDLPALKEQICSFELAWQHYEELQSIPQASSLYRLDYLWNQPAMGEMISHYKNMTETA